MKKKLLQLTAILLSAFWALLMLALPVALAKEAIGEGPSGQLPQYSTFNFPTKMPVAKIRYDLTTAGKNGQKMVQKALVLAQGRVNLPTNCDLSVDLCFDSLEHMELMAQLYPCRVAFFSASNLDFEDKHMRYLQGFKSLRCINLTSTLVSDTSLPQLALFPMLTTLRLDKSNITGTGFDSLNNIHNLSDISFEGISLKPGTIGKLKPLMPKLRGLGLGKTGLTKEDAAIFQELKAVRLLGIAGNRHIDNDCVKYLSHLKALVGLSIQDTSITDKSLPMLINLPNLRKVKVRDKDFWTSKKHQSKYGQVEFIDIESCGSMPAEFLAPMHF
jgi:hypothetical protein